jgi:hAT family C-terminal dimerisation region
VNGSPQKVDFTSCYQNLPQAFTDKVQEYFKLPCENFDTCDPLQWWAGRRSQFPNLSRFARDILSIPGEFTTDFLLFNHLLMFLSSSLYFMQDLLLL